MENIKKWLKENLLKNKLNLIISCVVLFCCVVLTALTGTAFGKFSKYQVYFYGKEEGNTNVTRVEKFSKYSPSLKDTAGDADIYVLEGEQPGPGLLVLGGTHPNEPSGQLTATILLENLKVKKGTVYIITETNRSAYTHSYPQEASPFYYTLETKEVDEDRNPILRTFKFGSRATNTNQQWPNPDVYVHALSGQKLSTNETRNLNRAYPGLENGTYTEKVAFAITELVRQNDIAMAIDLHEASPEYLTINAIVCHDRARVVGDATMDGSNRDINDHMLEYHIDYMGQDEMEALSREIHCETSPTDLHGLTHRELGDHTNTLALLCETSNAAQGKYRGAFTNDLITYGEENPDYEGDIFYEKSVMLKDYTPTGDENYSTKNGILYARPVTLSERVARHTESIYELVEAYNYMYEEKSLYDNTGVKKIYQEKGIDMDLHLTTQEEIDACYNKRISDGQFEIDWSKLYNIEEGTYTSLYASILDQKVGAFLHAPSK